LSIWSRIGWGVALWAVASSALGDLYQYDPTGQIRSITREDGRTLHFVYDANGSLLSLSSSDTEPTFNVTAISPTTLRRGESGLFTLYGSGLAAAGVTTSHPGLSIVSSVATEGTIELRLSATPDAQLGDAVLSVVAPGATAQQVVLTLLAVPPSLAPTPAPIAIPPDGHDYTYALRLSAVDTVPWSLTLATSDPAVAVTPAQISIPAGEREAAIQVHSSQPGSYQLQVDTGAASLQFPIFVTDEYQGINFALAPAVGVQLGRTVDGGDISMDVTSPAVGLSVGAMVRAIVPNQVVVGQSQQITLLGSGLSAATALTVVPPDGITLSALTPSSTGTEVVATLAVAADAPLGLRSLTLSRAAGNYPAWDNTLLVVALPPRVDGILPNYAPWGMVTPLRVVGEHLTPDLQATLTPADGLSVTVVSVAADGLSAELEVGVSAGATVGPRQLALHTAGGESSPELTPTNTLWIVDPDPLLVAPLMAAQVGVRLGSGSVTPVEESRQAVGGGVGVILGAGIVGREPAAWSQGTSFTFTLQGYGLSAIQALELLPADGIDLGAPVANADGSEVTVAVTVATTAPTTLRHLRLTTLDGQPYLFAAPELASIQVTTVAPMLASVFPNVIGRGESGQLSLTGSHLQQVTQVSLLPAAGVSCSAPTISADGTQLQVAYSVAADASLGERVVIAEGPSGQSSSLPSPLNTVTVSDNITGLGPLLAPQVGVSRAGESSPGTTSVTWMAPLVGVTLAQPSAPATASMELHAHGVGVTRGRAIYATTASPLFPGERGVLELRGVGLEALASATLLPADQGVTVSGFTTAADGHSAQLDVAVGLDAVAGYYRLHLLTTDGQPIEAAGPTLLRIPVAGGVPILDSVTPNSAQLLEQGLTLTLRGSYLSAADSVVLLPGEGIVVGSHYTISADGKTLQVPIYITPSAQSGVRVVQIHTAGGSSATAATPANTFTLEP